MNSRTSKAIQKFLDQHLAEWYTENGSTIVLEHLKSKNRWLTLLHKVESLPDVRYALGY